MSRVRRNPIPYQFCGMELKIGTFKANGRIDISYKSPDMKQAFTREYTPVMNDPGFPPSAAQTEIEVNISEDSDADAETKTTPTLALRVGEHPPAEIIQWTLQEKLPLHFLPALFREHPEARSGNIHFSVIAPYALTKLHAEASSLKASGKDREVKTLQSMIQLWGDKPLIELTPTYCEDDLVHKMTTTSATQCIRLMRKLYPCVILGTSSDPFVWTPYSHSGRKKKYTPKRRIRNVLLNVPPAPGKIAQAIKRCSKNIALNHDAAKFLAALILFTLGIDIEEVCALRAKHLISLRDSHEKGLLIEDIVVKQRKEDSDDQHTRKSRHIIETIDPPERRILGVNAILAACWNTYAAQHPHFRDEQLLLSNNENRKRVLSPSDFKTWLAKNFSDVIPDNCLVVEGENIRTSFDIEDTCVAVARYLLTDLAGYSNEELRYHFVQKPAAMDGKHYAGFDSPSATITMGKMQTKAISKLLGGGYALSTSSKVYQIEGQADCVSRVHIEIDLEKALETNDLISKSDLLLRMSALGFSQKISFIENKN